MDETVSPFIDYEDAPRFGYDWRLELWQPKVEH